MARVCFARTGLYRWAVPTPLLCLLGLLMATPAQAVEARVAFEEAYDNVENGDWYREADDDYGALAGPEAYVMDGLAAMYRATGDPLYLERLVWHIDGVLAQRDDVRHLKDYRGLESPCWQGTWYSYGYPYCWVGHSGSIIQPFVEFAALVERDGLGDRVAYDGLSFAEKAESYIFATEETVAYHEEQWNADGYYIIREDAWFMDWLAGHENPFNLSHQMGETLLVLYELTGEVAYLDKVEAMAERYQANLIQISSGAYVWPYWQADDIVDYGEDIGHASTTLTFVMMCLERGIVFDDQDATHFAATLVDQIFVDDLTALQNLGGGEPNIWSIDAGTHAWLPLTDHRTAVYTTVRNLYEVVYPPEDLVYAWALNGWAVLAEFEPVYRSADLPEIGLDDDPDTSSDNDWRKVTDEVVTITVEPASLLEPTIVPLEIDSTAEVAVRQWNGRDWTQTALWQASGSVLERHIPYEDAWPYADNEGRIRFQLVHDASAGTLWIRERPAYGLPKITSTAPGSGDVDEPLDYAPEATGDTPLWWSLAEYPDGTSIDRETGMIQFTPTKAGAYIFTLRLENVAGTDEQAFEYCVGAPEDCDEEDAKSTATDSPPVEPAVERLSCATASATSSGSVLSTWAILAVAAIRRRRGGTP